MAEWASTLVKSGGRSVGCGRALKSLMSTRATLACSSRRWSWGGSELVPNELETEHGHEELCYWPRARAPEGQVWRHAEAVCGSD